MSDWREQYREEKERSGLTWAEFHDRRFIHVDELDDATETLADLDNHVQVAAREYRGLKRELHELRVLLESEEYEL